VKKTPARRCLTHLPATCEAALAVLNDAAWEMVGVTVEQNEVTICPRVVAALKQARRILRDGLSAVEPKRGGE
jgi:hypothetical protein